MKISPIYLKTDRQLMKKNELQAIAQAAAKNIKTQEDLNEFWSMLTQIQVEAQCVVAITFLCIIGR